MEIIERNNFSLAENLCLLLDMKLDTAKIMKEIKLMRLENKIKSMEFADKIGISPQYYSQLENNARDLDIGLLNKICEAIGISTIELILKTHQNIDTNSDSAGKVIEAIENIISIYKNK
jgi:transcriptional regulator with XRE-family HTH domain